MMCDKSVCDVLYNCVTREGGRLGPGGGDKKFLAIVLGSTAATLMVLDLICVKIGVICCISVCGAAL